MVTVSKPSEQQVITTTSTMQQQLQEKTDHHPRSNGAVASPLWHSKNKHLSQSIHKKKKNRSKQKHFKKKQWLKEIKQQQHQQHHQPQAAHRSFKRPKLRVNRSASFDTMACAMDELDIEYSSNANANAMNEKHKKIQVIHDGTTPFYYLDHSDISSNTLHAYNYNVHPHQHQHRWMPSLQLRGSPMMRSPFLLPRNACADEKHAAVTECGGELLMGLQSNDDANGNVLFRNLNLAIASSMSPQRSQCQGSVASDYHFEGVVYHSNPEQLDVDITHCLNVLKMVNVASDTWTVNAVNQQKLNEMQDIIAQIKRKMEMKMDDGDNEDEDDDQQTCTDSRSCFLRSRVSLNTNSSDEECTCTCRGCRHGHHQNDHDLNGDETCTEVTELPVNEISGNNGDVNDHHSQSDEDEDGGGLILNSTFILNGTPSDCLLRNSR